MTATTTICPLCRGASPAGLPRVALISCCPHHITSLFLRGESGWTFVIHNRVRFAP